MYTFNKYSLLSTRILLCTILTAPCFRSGKINYPIGIARSLNVATKVVIHATMAYAPRVSMPLVPKQSPELVSGVVTMYDATKTTLLSLAGGASAISQLNLRAFLDTESPQPSIHQARIISSNGCH